MSKQVNTKEKKRNNVLVYLKYVFYFINFYFIFSIINLLNNIVEDDV